MLKPIEYRNTYIVAQEIPYGTVQIRPGDATQREGMLYKGPVNSLQTTTAASESDFQVSAYAEGLGLVRINSRWLNRMR